MPRRRTRANPIQTVPSQQEIAPNAAVMEAETIETVAVSQAAPVGEPTTPTVTLKQSTGKLANVIDHIGHAEGATIGDLIAATGWQPHTIRAVLSRLRRRGYTITLATDADGRKAYRLERKEG
jgi:hypothetical protein